MMTYREVLTVMAITAASAFFTEPAHATDRFDVVVELVSFKSLVDMDPSNENDEYYITVHADIPGEGRRSMYLANLKTAPMKTRRVGRRVQFRDIRKPSRSDRIVSISSDVSEKDVITKKGSIFDKPKRETRYDNMGTARRKTSTDLFRAADRDRDDTASETVSLQSRKYRMDVRVTVIEVD